MLGLPPLPCPLRLKEVIGLEGRTNDIVYCPPKLSDPATSAVIFFGGDVQVKTHLCLQDACTKENHFNFKECRRRV